MKYLKTFESLRDDYAIKMREIETLKNKALKEIKSEVDDYMNYILDDYQIGSEQDEIVEIHEEKFNIRYGKIKVPFNELEDKFLPLLKHVEKLLKDKLEVDLYLVGEFELAPVYGMGGGIHDLNFGHTSGITHLEKWIAYYNNTQPKVRNKYTYFNLGITII